MMWEHLSISHFKNRYSKGILWILLFGITIFLLTKGLNYLYVDDTEEFARCMLYELYTQEENIDRIYLGSSHVFCGINPVILDEMNGENNFNLATEWQPLIASYYLLKEADKKHKINKVYLDLYYECTTSGRGNFRAYENLPNSLSVLHQMKFSVNKLSYITHLSKPKDYYLSCFAFTRYKEKLFDFNYVSQVISKKRTDVYRKHLYEQVRKVDGRQYVLKSEKKGYRSYDGVINAGGFVETVAYTKKMGENPMTEESLEYLIKIADYCKEKGIEFTCIGCPISDYQLNRVEGYDNYVRQIYDLAEQYDFAYYDFNLCKEEYLDVSGEDNWLDMGHLNTIGAEKFTRFLGGVLSAEEKQEDIFQNYFYQTYEEKMQNWSERIWGLEILQQESSELNNGIVYQIHPIENLRKKDLWIKAWVQEENMEEEKVKLEVQRNEKDGIITLPDNTHGKIYIEVGMVGEKASNWQTIFY